ncbi:MAG: Hpt domain-containing protein [Pseudomonadota bacterium]
MNDTKTDTLDFSFLRSFLDTKEEMEETMAVFERSSDKALNNLETALSNNNHTVWAEAAHQMKGAASMVGATALAQSCDNAQNLAESEAEQRQALMSEIKNSYESAKSALHNEISNFSE